MSKQPKACVLIADGTNCDREMLFAFEQAGAVAERVHINQLRDRTRKLSDYQILGLAGGFSYGDDIRSGKVLAVELTAYLGDQVKDFLESPDRLVLGVCNGFQVLVQTGILPGTPDSARVTLTNNTSGHFECRWITVRLEKSACAFLRDEDYGRLLSLPIAHGEGRLVADKTLLDQIQNQGLTFARYSDDNGRITMKYPQNPNGSLLSIAGLTDSSGRVVGLMPHPERFISRTQHPNWRRQEPSREPDGRLLFTRMVEFVSA